MSLYNSYVSRMSNTRNTGILWTTFVLNNFIIWWQVCNFIWTTLLKNKTCSEFVIHEQTNILYFAIVHQILDFNWNENGIDFTTMFVFYSWVNNLLFGNVIFFLSANTIYYSCTVFFQSETLHRLYVYFKTKVYTNCGIPVSL